MPNILIVDDDPASRRFFVRLLGKENRLLEAADGEEGLAIARAERPDLLIADIVMPRMDGYELARKLHADPLTAATPVIFVSGIPPGAEGRHLARACGVQFFLEKPLRPGEILATVAAVLAAGPQSLSAPPVADFEREHLRLLTDRLAAKVDNLNQEIARRRQTEEQLRQSLEQMRALSAHIEGAREQERARIAREIHDDLGQSLTVLRLDLFWLKNQARHQKGEVPEKIDDMIVLAETTLQTMRQLAGELRPAVLDTLGLVPALEWQASEFSRRSGIRCLFEFRGDEGDPGRPLATALFRIVQEALTNVARHAQAREVRICLHREPDSLTLKLIDNGKGIRLEDLTNPRSLGLLGMRERAALLEGSLEIKGDPGKGTCLTVRIPLPTSHLTPLPHLGERGRGEG